MNMLRTLSAFALFGVLSAFPVAASAQEIIPIGNIERVADAAPTNWAMSGYVIFNVSQPDGQDSPITRTLRYDARTVEILSRTQNPPLSKSDVKVLAKNGHEYIVIRRYMLAEVLPQDAKAAGMSKTALANKWASSVAKVLVNVAPLPSRFGV